MREIQNQNMKIAFAQIRYWPVRSFLCRNVRWESEAVTAAIGDWQLRRRSEKRNEVRSRLMKQEKWRMSEIEIENS